MGKEESRGDMVRGGWGGACRLVQSEREGLRCSSVGWDGQRAQEMRCCCCSSRRGTEEERGRCYDMRERDHGREAEKIERNMIVQGLKRVINVR